MEIAEGKVPAITGEPKILIVEDDPMIRLLYQRTLGGHGLKADSAENGAVAVPLIKRHEYDLIISDLCMPEMGGMELLGWIGAFKPHVVDRLIICTAAISEEIETHTLRSRFTLLQKPVEPELFMKTVFGLLKKNPAI